MYNAKRNMYPEMEESLIITVVIITALFICLFHARPHVKRRKENGLMATVA